MFERRPEKTQNEEERKVIFVFMAFVILHEIAHLILRWYGIKRTNKKCFLNVSFLDEV